MRTALNPTCQSVTYRRARLGDRDGILAISAAVSVEDWIPLVIDVGLRARTGGFFVAEVGGRVVGVCGAGIRGKAAWLQAMRVHPDFRGLGIATELTRHVLDACAAAGCRYARLSTAVDNEAVHRFVGPKLGFRALGRWAVADDVLDLSGAFVEAPELRGVRRAGPADLDAAWAFLESRRRAGLISPPRLAAPVSDPWSVAGFDRRVFGTHLRAGRVFVAGKAAGGADPAGFGETRGVALGIGVTAEDFRRSMIPLWPAIIYVEGATPDATAALLEALLAAARDNPDIRRLTLSLPWSQWEAIRRVVRPGWPAEGLSLDAVIYHKDLTQTGGGGGP